MVLTIRELLPFPKQWLKIGGTSEIAGNSDQTLNINAE